jgi:cytochrome c oxidase subunit 1
MALIGALFHWWPKITGRMYKESLGILSAILVFIGFNITFFPQFLVGLHGMPRRYFNYPDAFQTLNVVSTLGSYVLAVGFFMALIALLHGMMRGRPAPANPWGGVSLEWRTTSPPPVENFKEIPAVTDPYDMSLVAYDTKTDSYYFKDERTS